MLLDRLKIALFSLSVFKQTLGFKMYLNIILPLLGGFQFLRDRSPIRLLLPFQILLLINLAVVVFKGEYQAIPRLGQLWCLLYFCSFIEKQMPKEILDKSIKLIAVMGFLFIFVEMIFGPPLEGYIPFLKTDFTRQYGIYGEPNFSAMLMFGVALYLIVFGFYKFSLLAIIALVFTVSKGTMLALLLFFALFSLKKLKRLQTWALNILMIVFLFIPLPIYMSGKMLSYPQKLFMHQLTSKRYFLFLPYIKMGIDHPLGVGYFQGPKYIANYQKSEISEFSEEQKARILALQQHSIFVQIFSEFGLIGYLIFSFQLWWLFKISLKNREYEISAAFVSVLAGFSLLNGLSEMTLYLFIGLIMSYDGLRNKKITL
ncbi:MAG: hypothetical protein HOE90_11500 [Bacteriovoracaceae bacterium]|nr:hypothetical protein [Bacteriovoracaceae bacterium]